MKISIFKFSLIHPHHSLYFPNMNKVLFNANNCCACYENIVINSERLKESSLNCIKSPFSKGLNYRHLSKHIYLRILFN
jgi:hypothetical protein